MSLKIKIIVTSLFLIIILGVCGFLYYKYAAGFDNKKQYEVAEKLYKEGNYQEAYVSFLNIKYFSKYRKAAVLKQALSAEKLGDWPVAENKYEEFLKLEKNANSFAERAKYSYAKACYMNKNYDKAVNLFLDIRKNSAVDDYKKASDYFLGKISLAKNLTTPAKKYYMSYIKNVPTGTYSLSIATDALNLPLNEQEAVLVSKIFLANQKYDDAISALKNTPKEKCWTYLAIANYYKNDFDKFKKLAIEGYSKNCKNITREDLISFTDFYISMQKDAQKALSDLQKSNANSVIPDYFIYKKAQYLPEDKKITELKEIVKKYPKSSYITDCLEKIFFDFGNRKQYRAAAKTGEIFTLKFPDAKAEPQILFWTGKYLQKIRNDEEANQYFTKVKEKYPSSYYAFRAENSEQNPKISWLFTKNLLPAPKEIKFPIQTLQEKDLPLAHLFLDLHDGTIWDEIPFNNSAVRAWVEYKNKNIPKSVYLANKYITESKTKIPYDNPVWKLAFPIMYEELINKNCQKYNLDAFLILSLIKEESHFNEKAVSATNATGLMQLMIPTAEDTAEKIGMMPPDEKKLQNPEYNIALGTAYFADVLAQTGNFPMFAVGGYNGGPNAMNKWVENHKSNDLDEFVENIAYDETQFYIKKVYRSRYNYSKIYEK